MITRLVSPENPTTQELVKAATSGDLRSASGAIATLRERRDPAAAVALKEIVEHGLRLGANRGWLGGDEETKIVEAVEALASVGAPELHLAAVEAVLSSHMASAIHADIEPSDADAAQALATRLVSRALEKGLAGATRHPSPPGAVYVLREPADLGGFFETLFEEHDLEAPVVVLCENTGSMTSGQWGLAELVDGGRGHFITWGLEENALLFGAWDPVDDPAARHECLVRVSESFLEYFFSTERIRGLPFDALLVGLDGSRWLWDEVDRALIEWSAADAFGDIDVQAEANEAGVSVEAARALLQSLQAGHLLPRAEAAPDVNRFRAWLFLSVVQY
jgi:hypothetical protein